MFRMTSIPTRTTTTTTATIQRVQRVQRCVVWSCAFVLLWNQLVLLTLLPKVTSQNTSTPSCYNNLTVIHLLNIVKDPFVHVTYTLCPNTIYNIGVEDEDEFIVIEPGYQHPIDVASNTKYQCGSTGQSSNNCTLIGGVWQLYNTGLVFGDIPTKNSSIHGITFQNAQNNAMLLGNRGDIVFYDCIFKDHTNFGTVVLAYFGPPPETRRRELLSEPPEQQPQQQKQLDEVVGENNNLYNNNNNTIPTQKGSTISLSNVEYLRSIQRRMATRSTSTNDNDNNRILQSDNEAELRMKVTFDSCTFYNNTIGDVESDQSLPGVIYVYFVYTDLILYNTTFLYNNFDVGSTRTTRQSSTANSNQGYAVFIKEPGSTVSIQDTCFIQNQFIGNGPVQLNDITIVNELQNNYVDDRSSLGLNCSFINMINNGTCIDSDATTCPHNTSSSIVLPPMALPTTAPSSNSVPVPVQSPVSTPVEAPVSTPTTNGSSSRSITLRTTATLVIILMTFSIVSYL